LIWVENKKINKMERYFFVVYTYTPFQTERTSSSVLKIEGKLTKNGVQKALNDLLLDRVRECNVAFTLLSFPQELTKEQYEEWIS
jgi:hypothetical protein